MRTIVHLSDIHFGRTDPAMLGPLIEAVHEAKPDLVAISGDLTQRARTSEFLEARAFLDALPEPRIVVPGNHDVPLHNLYARFAEGLDRYRHYITPDLAPSFRDEELAVAGINTARLAVWKGGRISHAEIARAHDFFLAAGDRALKIIVTHHPFELPEGAASGVVGRARVAIERLALSGADLFLAGHLHLGFTAHTAARYGTSGHSALVIQAGTAASTRGRGEPNSFSLIRAAKPEVRVARMVWDDQRRYFVSAGNQAFRRDGLIWLAADG